MPSGPPLVAAAGAGSSAAAERSGRGICTTRVVEFLLMHAFSPDAARTFPQPWAAERVAAAERAAAAEFPTPADEIWRYSRIEELDLERFTPRLVATSIAGGEGLVADPGPDVLESAAPDVFAELNAAFVSPLVVRVPAGRAVTDPV